MADADCGIEQIGLRAQTEGLYRHSEIPVDYPGWAKESCWTAEAAVSLSFGLEPDEVLWQHVESKSDTSSLAHQLSRRLKLVKRVQAAGDLSNSMSPHRFILWTQSRGIEVSEQLIVAINQFGRPIPDYEMMYRQIKSQFDTTPTLFAVTTNRDDGSGVQAKQVGDVRQAAALKKKVATLQKMLLAMVLEKYRYNMDDVQTSTASNIVNDLEKWNLKLNVDTVRDHLTEAKNTFRSLAKNTQAD